MKRQFSLCPHRSPFPSSLSRCGSQRLSSFSVCIVVWGWWHCSNMPASGPTYWFLRQECLPWDCLRDHAAFTGNISSVTSAEGLRVSLLTGSPLSLNPAWLIFVVVTVPCLSRWSRRSMMSRTFSLLTMVSPWSRTGTVKISQEHRKCSIHICWVNEWIGWSLKIYLL